jgi:CubicO group peptidase (beta-lactamase class C family)
VARPADEVENLVRGEMAQHHVPGVACLVIKDGQRLATIYAGQGNLEWDQPVTNDTAFEIGSITKQFTAACILTLAEAGKLSVDDPISQYLTNPPPAWAGIKIRHLLSHTSGLTNYDHLAGFEMQRRLTQAEFIARLGKYPLVFPPGDAWSYCNSGFNLLGYIVENVSGEPYWKFLHEHILDPLQMTNTYERDPATLVPHRANGYVWRKTAGLWQNRDTDLTDLFSAGTMVSTVEDLAKWDAAIQGEGILSAATKKLWWTPVTLNNGQPITRVGRHAGSYGYGWFLNPERAHPSIWHTGVTTGFSAANQWYPGDHLTIIVLSNTDESAFGGALADKIADYYLAPAPKPL